MATWQHLGQFLAIFSLCMPRNGYMNFQLKFWHQHLLPWPRFPFRARYLAIWGRFLLIFALDKLNVRHISTSFIRSSWPTDLESVSRDAHLAVTVSTKFEVDTTIRCLVIASLCCWYVTWPCDLDLWPFDFGQWSYMAGHVINPSTKFEDPTTIRSWVMSSDISHRIPLTWEGRSLGGKISPANILIPLDRQLIALHHYCWQFLYNETLQQTFRPLLTMSSKRWQI